MKKTWREFLYFLFCHSGAKGFVFSLNEEPQALVWPPDFGRHLQARRTDKEL